MDERLATLKREDFEQTFESEGTSFLFEDLVVNYYTKQFGESVSLMQGSKKTFYTTRTTIDRLRAEGLLRTTTQTKEQITLLNSCAEGALSFAAVLTNRNTITLEETQEACAFLGKAFAAYLYFDAWYWDALFKKSKTDTDAAETVRLVEEYKNIARAKFEPLCFTPDSLLLTTVSILSKQFDIPVTDIEWYREADIAVLFSNKKVSQLEITNRKQASLYYVDASKQGFFISGAEAEEFIHTFDAKVETATELRGSSAHVGVGVVRGAVRVLRRDYGNPAATQQQMDEMAAGEVLVSETTDPELIPAFKKASAVITDIGGLLSHAAITSREMNLPCIVGVAGASRVLKTGDLVEVDAHKGIVIILQKAHE